MTITTINKRLRKSFSDKVWATLENNCIVMRGALEHCEDIVAACQMAATKYSSCHVVNDIQFTGGDIPPMRTPKQFDHTLHNQTPDVLIIGGGISGASIARELSKWNLDILLVEKEADLALQASGRNDGEVHAGVDLGKGSLKHHYLLEGNRMYDKICRELDVDFERVGQYACFESSAHLYHKHLQNHTYGFCYTH